MAGEEPSYGNKYSYEDVDERSAEERAMIGFQSLLQELQNGGILLFTTSPPSSAPESSLSLTPCPNSDAFTMFIAITFPFFNGLLSFFGGFAFAPTTYFLPCILWLVICKPKRFSLSWFVNMICIIFGVGLTIVGPIAEARRINSTNN